ncbi:MAG: hypothetical protein WD674_08505, partial [Cucumibacter sp.]
SNDFRMSAAAVLCALALGLAPLAVASPAQAQERLTTKDNGYLPGDMVTPPSGTVIDCLLVEASAGKLFLVGCTAQYTGVIVQVSELTAGYLICKNFDSIRCRDVVPIIFQADQAPLDAAEPLVCTVSGRTFTDDLSFKCVQ